MLVEKDTADNNNSNYSHSFQKIFVPLQRTYCKAV